MQPEFLRPSAQASNCHMINPWIIININESFGIIGKGQIAVIGRFCKAAVVLSFLFVPKTSLATMPVLTPRPEPGGLKACQLWALDQNDDAKWMWGIKPSGNHSLDVGVGRLVLHCLGDTVPDIVGFGSSIDFDTRFCDSHSEARVCQERREQATRSLKPQMSALLDVQIYYGGITDGEACGSSGVVMGLDPHGDGFLSVRSGPGGKPFREIARVFNGQRVYICEDRGNWFGVVYSPDNGDPQACGIFSPIRIRAPYTGPCQHGWISKRYVGDLAG